MLTPKIKFFDFANESVARSGFDQALPVAAASRLWIPE